MVKATNKRFEITLDKSIYEFLSQVAEKTGKTKSNIVEIALAYLMAGAPALQEEGEEND